LRGGFGQRFWLSPACTYLVKEVGALQLVAAELQLRQRAVLPDWQRCIQNVLAYQTFERCPQAEGLADLLQSSIVGALRLCLCMMMKVTQGYYGLHQNFLSSVQNSQ
jgi:hypothetical protein